MLKHGPRISDYDVSLFESLNLLVSLFLGSPDHLFLRGFQKTRTILVRASSIISDRFEAR